MKWVSIGSDNGLWPVRRQSITWTNAVSLSIGPLGTNFREILIKIHTFSFKKMQQKMSSAKLAAILSKGKWVNPWSRHHHPCMGKTFWVEFQRVPLKFHTKYFTHSLKDTGILCTFENLGALLFKSLYAFFQMHPWQPMSSGTKCTFGSGKGLPDRTGHLDQHRLDNHQGGI